MTARGPAPDPSAALEQQNRELAILNMIAGALNASADLSASLGTALAHVASLLHLRAGWVWLLDERTGEPRLAAAANLPPALSDHPERMEGACFCLGAFQKGELDGAANIVTCSRLKWLTESEGLRFHASIPLSARGRRLGVMNVASTEWRELTQGELRLLHTIGEMVGVAVERSRLFERSAEAGAAEERNRLAREIHDTLAQGLAASALQLETAEALLEAGGEAARIRAAVHQALTVTRQNLEDARRSVLDLRPAPLQGSSLLQALRDLTVGSSAEGGPEVRFEAAGGARTLAARVEGALYRVAQEAMGNALRHADAATITVRLQSEPHRVALSVTDDGVGFEAEDVCGTHPPLESPGHFGLIGMCERIRLLDGEFRVQSSPGRGTTVEALVPLD